MHQKLNYLFIILSLVIPLNGSCQGKDSNLNRLEGPIDDLIHFGIQQKAFPGAQVLIYKNGQIQLHKSYGFHTYDSIAKVEDDHLYDLASVTKVLAATLAFMKLYELYDINLEDKVSQYIPILKNSNKKNTTFKEVLSHSAGWLPYIAHQNTIFKKNGNLKKRTLSSLPNRKYPIQISDSLYIHKNYSKKIFRRIKKTPLGELNTYKYSGLWFFFLPKMVQSLSGLSFTSFLEKHFYKPLELEHLTFLPIQRFSKNTIVPTEKDSLFRKQLVQGWVHDEAAAMMGGISGNAGLFSNAQSIAPLLQMLLDQGTHQGKKYLEPQTINTFIQQTYPNSLNRRGLGFDKPSIDPNQESPYPSALASPDSFGHSGFTGTFVWVDPSHDCFVIFLSNRVYPSRKQRALYDLSIRGTLLDYAIQF
ncbi:MAG: serine hydrolase [Flavobacteriaceae bacterium]